MQMTPEARMRVVFENLAADDMDALISNWAQDGTYFNPNVGPPAQGIENVRETITKLSDGLRERGEKLVIDRATQEMDASPERTYIEWHVEGGAKPGRLGLHVVLFNEAGLLHRVTVFMHAA